MRVEHAHSRDPHEQIGHPNRRKNGGGTPWLVEGKEPERPRDQGLTEVVGVSGPRLESGVEDPGSIWVGSEPVQLPVGDRLQGEPEYEEKQCDRVGPGEWILRTGSRAHQ